MQKLQKKSPRNTLRLMLITIVTGGLTSIFSLQTLATSNCSDLTGCEKKFCEINKQLTIAQHNHDNNKANGLKKALEQAKENCTNTKLKKDLMTNISNAKENIAEYDADLIEAESAGKTTKVHKYQNKISEKESKIKSLEKELSSLH